MTNSKLPSMIPGSICLAVYENDDIRVEIDSFEEYTDLMEVVDVYGQGSNTPTKKGISGWYGVAILQVLDKETGNMGDFHVQFTNSQRTDNIEGYNGIDIVLDYDNCDDANVVMDLAGYDKGFQRFLEGYAEKKASIHLPKDEDRCPAITEEQDQILNGLKGKTVRLTVETNKLTSATIEIPDFESIDSLLTGCEINGMVMFEDAYGNSAGSRNNRLEKILKIESYNFGYEVVYEDK